MDEAIEKRLKDYNGYEIWKIIDNKGQKNEKVIYMACMNEECVNCTSDLKTLKSWIKKIM